MVMQKIRGNNRIIVFVIGFVVFAFLALIVFDWGMNYSGRAGAPGEMKAFTVNGEGMELKPFFQLYNDRYSDYGAQLRGEGREPGAKDEYEILKQVLDQTIKQFIARQESERLGIVITDEEVVAAVREQFRDPETGMLKTEEYNQTMARVPTQQLAAFEKSIREELARKKVSEYYTSGVRLSDVQLTDFFERVYQAADARQILIDPADYLNPALAREFYEENQELFHTPERIRASHILLRLEPNASNEKRLEVQTQARELLLRAKAGESFAELAGEYSEDPVSAERGGDLGEFGRGQMVPQFEEAAFRLRTGEISDLVESPYGIHIIKKTGVTPSRQRPYSEVAQDIRRTMVSDTQMLVYTVESGEAYSAWMGFFQEHPELSSLRKEAWDSAKAEADRVKGLVDEEGSDFAALARRYSDAPSAARGGEIGKIFLYFNEARSDLYSEAEVEALEQEAAITAQGQTYILRQVTETLLSLKNHTPSEVIETPKGYHIFWVESKLVGDPELLQENRPQLERSALSLYRDQMYEDLLNKRKEESKVWINPTLQDELDRMKTRADEEAKKADAGMELLPLEVQ